MQQNDIIDLHRLDQSTIFIDTENAIINRRNKYGTSILMSAAFVLYDQFGCKSAATR